MGDTTTHEAIETGIISDIFKPLRPTENFAYFKLGNWLTDLSQVRDPSAMVGAKTTIWKLKTNLFTAMLAQPFKDLYDYLDDLMGPPGKEGGLLAAWLRELGYVWGLEKFTAQGIPEERFIDIYDRHFTQYYPHEHMDFPPWPVHDIVGERKPSQAAPHQCGQPPASGGGRKVYQYLEDQIVYIAELLTVVEDKWAWQVEHPDDEDARQVLLVRYGHASHAIEDFFFHSNFVERAWQDTKQPLPDRGGDEDSGDHGGGNEEAGPRNAVREQRRFNRRLRSPVASGDTLSTNRSELFDQVFTGFFSGNDVFNTLVDAVKGLAGKAKQQEQKKDIPAPIQGYLAGLLGQPRHPGETDDELEQRREKELEAHKKRLFAGEYELIAEAAVAAGQLRPKSLDAIRRMCQMDRNLWTKYAKANFGISGFVKTLGELADDTYKSSKKVWTALDEKGVVDDPGAGETIATDNGASNEVIGSHSLMAKDSDRKHPLRNEAFNLAATAARYVAISMVRPRPEKLDVSRSFNDSVSANVVNQARIDWLHLLQHFIAHPLEAQKTGGEFWWRARLAEINENRTSHDLSYIDDATFAQRVKEEMRPRLEQRYDQLAIDAEREWRIRRGWAVNGTLVGMALGAVAGAIAGAMAGAMIGGAFGPAGAVVGAILGAIVGAVVGVIVGGVVGALVGAAVPALAL